ncbi:IS701 family transposase, partial [Gloeocapsa sp. PCC 73106]|uniref:IS701 family transposase n=1 Tax=Gloeocapsa sp. PCC 73106 TaxID=102232 RepID=UPI0002AC4750
MDVAEQIKKHLPREADTTVPEIDKYCEYYRSLFPEVRSYECFKYLHLGIISTLKRKSLPEISKIVGISSQSLHHFISKSPWSKSELETRRLKRIKKILRNQEIAIIIDETGDRKKGKKTDYVSRQYLGSIGKVDNGIVSVNSYGVYQNITFPLITRIYKPKGKLKSEDKYKSKTEIAVDIIKEIKKIGLNIKIVLADSLYGESSNFLDIIYEYGLEYVVAIRSNHGVWLPSSQRVRANKWCKFTRTFSDGTQETRYIREIIYGQKRATTYWQITTDYET